MSNLNQPIVEWRVAVLHGGLSAEREISLKSGRAVFEGLKASGVACELLDFPEKSIDFLRDKQFDCAFVALHGRGGEDGSIQGALELAKIPYTGSGVLASALAMDKSKSKLIWQALGLPTPKGVVVDSANPPTNLEAENLLSEMGHVVAVKPIKEGSSVGVSKASTAAELIHCIEKAGQYDEQVLIEKWLNGAEYTVGIVGTHVLPSIRLQAANDFYDYDAKYLSNQTQYHCPSGLEEREERELQKLARHAFDSLGCVGWGRVDFICDDDGQFYLLEVNTIPGMTPTSLVPKAAKAIGWDFPRLLLEILETVKKHGQSKTLASDTEGKTEKSGQSIPR